MHGFQMALECSIVLLQLILSYLDWICTPVILPLRCLSSQEHLVLGLIAQMIKVSNCDHSTHSHTKWS